MLGCEKIDMFEETNSGVGVLAFKLNGKNIHNCAFPHYFLGPIVTEIKAKINAQDSLIIESLLADNYYTEMKMSISLTELRSSNIIENPFITFTYIYIDVFLLRQVLTESQLVSGITIMKLK